MDSINSAFSVLAVCTGNICRSPAVEHLLRSALGEDASVRVASAGTHALVGHPVAGPMAALLHSRGIDTSGFSARQLAVPMLADADLVLALTRQHRSAIVTEQPRALRRTFTLREFARLVASGAAPVPEAGGAASSGTGSAASIEAGTAAERLARLVDQAGARRGSHGHEPILDDVVDPWRRSEAVYAESLRQITEALDSIESALSS